MMTRSPLILALMAFASSGCSLLFDDVYVEECGLDEHCLAGEYCDRNTGRCVLGTNPVIVMPDEGGVVPPMDPEMGVEMMVEGAPLDDGLPPVDAADMDVGPDEPDDGPPDADLGAPVPFMAPFPDSECFASTENPLRGRLEGYEAESGSTHVPYAVCSPYGVVWTDTGMDGSVVHVAPPPSAGSPPPYAYQEGTSPLIFGSKLIVSRANPDFEGATNLYWIDLEDGDSGWLRASARTQSRPAVGDGFLAFIESAGPDDGDVVFVRDDLRALPCPPESGARWGVAAAGRSVAWFERPERARRDRLVTVGSFDPEAMVCPSVRRERLLSGVVDRAVGVHLAGAFAFWFERAEGADMNEVYRWAYRNPRVLTPERYEPPHAKEGAPVAMTTAGDVVVIVRFQWDSRQRYVFEFTPPTLDVNVETFGDLRRPTLSPHYLMWAEKNREPAWEIRYARLR